MGASARQHASVNVALLWEGKYVGFEAGSVCVGGWVCLSYVYIPMLMKLLGSGTQVLHVKLDERLQQIFGEERLPLRRVSERLAINSEKSST